MCSSIHQKYVHDYGGTSMTCLTLQKDFPSLFLGSVGLVSFVVLLWLGLWLLHVDFVVCFVLILARYTWQGKKGRYRSMARRLCSYVMQARVSLKGKITNELYFKRVSGPLRTFPGAASFRAGTSWSSMCKGGCIFFCFWDRKKMGGNSERLRIKYKVLVHGQNNVEVAYSITELPAFALPLQNPLPKSRTLDHFALIVSCRRDQTFD